MNLVILKGYVGKEPRIVDFPEGGKIASFSLATVERGFTTRDGKEVKEKTEWHNIVVKKKGLAGVAEKYIKKGTPLLVQGHLETRSYESQDGSRYITEIVADEMELLASKEKENKQGYQPISNDYPN